MIWVFGDSFSTNMSSASWVAMLSEQHKVVNLSSNGSSEYRIWKNYQNNKHRIHNSDTVIFCHTSPSRIFLKDSESLLSRLLRTHLNCDLIVNDVFSKGESKFVKVLRTIWDDDFFNDTYTLYVDNLKQVPNSIHFTFFESSKIESLHDVWLANKGTVNHMNVQGNKTVLEFLKGKLDVQS